MTVFCHIINLSCGLAYWLIGTLGSGQKNSLKARENQPANQPTS